MIPHDYGEPIQVWKWPALVIVSFFQAFGVASPGAEPAAFAGGFIGTLVGLVIAFYIGTALFRRVRPEPGMGWKVYAACLTLASPFALFGAVSGNALGVFLFVYLFLLGVAVVGHLTIKGVRSASEKVRSRSA